VFLCDCNLKLMVYLILSDTVISLHGTHFSSSLLHAQANLNSCWQIEIGPNTCSKLFMDQGGLGVVVYDILNHNYCI